MVPFSISTDLHMRNIDGPVHDMATTMSKLLAVGVPLEECVAASTTRPRSILGLSGPSGLKAGQRADFTIFDLEDAAVETVDSLGTKLTLGQMFEPRMTIIGASAEPAKRRAS
jgi:dihydroorotase